MGPSPIYSSNPWGRSSGAFNSFVCLSVCVLVCRVAFVVSRYIDAVTVLAAAVRLRASPRLGPPAATLQSAPPFVEKGASVCLFVCLSVRVCPSLSAREGVGRYSPGRDRVFVVTLQ